MRWYFRFQLSLRDIEELLLQRGLTVTYETIRCWCNKFDEGFAHRVKAARQGGRQALLQACAAIEPGARSDFESASKVNAGDAVNAVSECLYFRSDSPCFMVASCLAPSNSSAEPSYRVTVVANSLFR